MEGKRMGEKIDPITHPTNWQSLERAECRYHVHSAVEFLLLMSDAIPVRDWRLHPNGSTRVRYSASTVQVQPLKLSQEYGTSTAPLTHQLGESVSVRINSKRVEFPVRLSLPLCEESVTNGMLGNTPRAPPSK